MEKLDEKDKKILEILKENGDYTTRQIAKKTLFPQTTIHNRIKKLRRLGVIKKYTIELDHKKIGRGVGALILVNCEYDSLRAQKKDQHDLAKEILRLPEVEKVDIVTGAIDMVVRVRVRDIEAYDTFLLKKFQRIKGIDRTQSLMVIHEK